MNSFRDFLILADEDLKDAKIMMENRRYAKACYFAQQSIEKYLKAFLIKKMRFDIKRHRTHNLILLLEECSDIDSSFKELEEMSLGKISIYAVEPRYRLDFFLKVTEQDAREAIDVAEKVRNFILRKLNIKNL